MPKKEFKRLLKYISKYGVGCFSNDDISTDLLRLFYKTLCDKADNTRRRLWEHDYRSRSRLVRNLFELTHTASVVHNALDKRGCVNHYDNEYHLVFLDAQLYALRCR